MARDTDNTVDVTVIIVSYNTREMTLECLRSLKKQTAGISYETIVVDNISTDGSADAIAAEFPDLRLERLTTNIGFAAANNLAAQWARGEFLLLLNPDTIVLDGAVQKLVQFARRTPLAGIWGGRTVFDDGSLNPTSCWMRQTVWSLTCRAFGLTGMARASGLLNPESMGNWQRDSERDVDIVTGCFFLVQRALWEELGGFDRAFFVYGEEADLCLRARKLGAQPRMTPTATIVHYGGASETVKADKLVRLLRAKAQLIRRHWPHWLQWYGVWMLAQGSLAHAVAWRVKLVLRPRTPREKAEYWMAGWTRRREWMSEPPLPAEPAPASGSVVRNASRGACGAGSRANGVEAGRT